MSEERQKITREEALEYHLNRLGYVVSADQEGYILVNGKWSPITIRCVDPVPALENAVREIKKRQGRERARR